jgi:Taurine catabolism dioxygenase TauD, TfdA family
MSTFLEQQVTGPAVWKGQDMRQRDDWIWHLTPAEISQIDAALQHARASGVPLLHITAADFPLQSLSSRLVALRNEVANGRGFALVRGFPVERYPVDDARMLFWGLSSHLGQAEGQDRAGNVMHQVTDTGKRVEGSNSTRGYETNNELMFHNDGGDAFALLCLRTAKSGGTSKLMSAGALFNEILLRRPDLARVVQEPFHFDARSQNPADLKVQTVPVFTHHAGYLNVLHKRSYIETAQRFEEVPRLTPLQREALTMIDDICNDPSWHLSFDMQQGDIQIGNNFSILHSRTTYQDHAEPERRRLLLRIWMTLPNGRPLPEVYAATREFGQTYRRREQALAMA